MNPADRRFAARAVIAVAIMALIGACQTTQGADKTGGDTVVLRLATFEGEVNANGQNHGLQAFVDDLGKVSGGRLKVEVNTDYGDGAPDAESQLVRAIAAGEVDGGWPSTRAFANAGIPGLEVVEAPMTITSYAAEKALASGPVAAKLLGRLDGTGVVGLGLEVGPLRRPFAAKQPLLGPGDWKGISFRVFNSPSRPTPCAPSGLPRPT
jgi:TRAP-type C4-dicarboxylate transport system substrate-binding protein